MARPDDHVIVQRPQDGWDGLDLRSTVFNVDPESAREATNVDTTQSSGSLISRQGYKGCIANSGGGYGLLKYTHLDSTTGQNVVEELVVKDNLYKINSDTFSITYTDLDAESFLRAGITTRGRGLILPNPTGSLDSGDIGIGISTAYMPGLVISSIPFVYVNHLVSSDDHQTGTWLFEIYVDGEQALAFTTSVGFDETSPPTLAQLKTAIEAVPGFFVSIGSGLSTSLPAAMAIPSLAAEPLESNQLNIACEYLTAVNKPGGVTTTFANTTTARNSPYFENATSYNVNSVIYINTGYDAQKKYDGQKCYDSGLPTPATTFAAAVGAGGNVDAGGHDYTVFYRQRDNRGNITEGEESASATVTPGVASIINLTIPNIRTTTGYNTDQAIVSGAQTGVTTIATNAHSLKVGDNITFINRSGGALVTDRTITAIPTSTSITISGSAVNVNNNDIISAGLTIQITRTKLGDTTPYYVAEIPNNSASATQSYADNVADSSISSVFGRPPIGFEHGLPPQCRYGVLFSGIPVMTGALTDGDSVFYADTTSPEHWPSLNSFRIRSRDQDVNTGLFPSQEYLLVFKERATYLVSGDLANDDFIVQERTLQVGCSSHASIAQLADGSVAFMSFRGPQRLSGSGEPDDIGYNVLPLFLANLPDDQTLQLKRSIGISDIKSQKVYFYIPCESTVGSDVGANDNSIVLMLDTQLGKTDTFAGATVRQDPYRTGHIRIGSWYLWTNMNWSGGATIIGDRIRWIERRYSSFDGDLAFHVYKRLNSGTVYDFVDHIDAITWRYASGWETLDAPSVYKLPLRLKIYSQDPLIAPMYMMTVQTNLDYTEAVHTQFVASVGAAGSSGGYGVDSYGVAPYGNPIAQEVLTNILRQRCQAFAYVFFHSMIYGSPLLTSWETEISVPFNAGIKK